MYTNILDGDVRTVPAMHLPTAYTLKAVWGYNKYDAAIVKHAEHQWEILSLSFPARPFDIVREAMRCESCMVVLYRR